MIAVDLQPFSVLSDHCLRGVMAEAVPGCALPLSQVTVPKLYDDTGTKVQKEL